MKITLCGSIAFIDEMESLANELVSLGHEVKFPPIMLTLPDGSRVKSNEYYTTKKKADWSDEKMWEKVHENIVNHFEKIE